MIRLEFIKVKVMPKLIKETYTDWKQLALVKHYLEFSVLIIS
jgi:hypothetical protein